MSNAQKSERFLACRKRESVSIPPHRYSFFKHKRAQIWAIDLAIALVLFIGVIFLFYRFSISFAPEDPLINKMINEGGFVSNMLLSTGFPPDWSSHDLDYTVSIGVLDSNGMLNMSKVDAWKEWIANPKTTGQLNYTISKRKINTQYEYYIDFYNGTSLNSVGWNFNGENPKQIIKIQRLVAYNDPDSGQIIPIKLNLYLWTNKNL